MMENFSEGDNVSAPSSSSSSSSCGGDSRQCDYRALTVGGGHTIRLSKAESESVSAIRTSTLKSQRKIALVLDIDHTMLHACGSITEAKPFGYEHCNLKYLPLIDPYGRISHHWLRLRPNLLEFIEEANKTCLLYVYTHGTRSYAEGVASILDPTKKYFANRIFSKTDVPELGSDKKLERICLGEADMALIMDDNEYVWRGPQQRQLLLVKPYQFFKKMKDVNNAPGHILYETILFVVYLINSIHLAAISLFYLLPLLFLLLFHTGAITTWNTQNTQPENNEEAAENVMVEDTEEDDDQLMKCLSFIQRVHKLQYPDEDPSIDSNLSTTSMTVLDHVVQIRKSVLKGYGFAFSGVFPTNYPMHEHPFYTTTLSLGAEVCVDSHITKHSRVTHLITVETHMNSSKVQSCLSNRDDVWVVHKDWLRYVHTKNIFNIA